MNLWGSRAGAPYGDTFSPTHELQWFVRDNIAAVATRTRRSSESNIAEGEP